MRTASLFSSLFLFFSLSLSLFLSLFEELTKSKCFIYLYDYILYIIYI